MFKKNMDSNGNHNQSALSIVYAGQFHIIELKHIIEFFSLPYELKHCIDYNEHDEDADNTSRCLDFSSFSIDLNKLLHK